MEPLLINLIVALLGALIGWLRRRRIVLTDAGTPDEIRKRWDDYIRKQLFGRWPSP